MSGTSAYQWADLPRELLRMIGKYLDSRVDVFRFRAVCTSWRSSVPLPSFDPRLLELPYPYPIAVDAVLLQATICRLELLHQNSNSSSVSKGWLTRVEESASGRLRLLDPFSNHHSYSCTLNLLDVRFFPLSKAFMLKRLGVSSIDKINKVVLFPVSASLSINDFAILAIYDDGKLGYWKYGDEEWKLLDDKNFEYDDVIVYRGQFYVVDRWGLVSWIDHSSLKVIQYAPPLCGLGGQKNLVESCGDLYVVDRYLDEKRCKWIDNETDYDNLFRLVGRFRSGPNPKAIDFRVYKLDEEWGKWVDVKCLDDRVFVLGMDCCFSVSSGDLVGGKSNCIYFTDDENYCGGDFCAISVFQLEDRSIVKLRSLPQYSEVFWPPSGLSTSSI